MSFGGIPGHGFEVKYRDSIDAAITYAVQNNVVLVAASGNYNQGRVLYPASHPEVIAVGSIDKDTLRYKNSCYGWELDVVAPGVDIWSTGVSIENHGTTVVHGYDSFEGTSFAAPLVSGIASLILSVNQNLTRVEVRNIINNTAKKVRKDEYEYNLFPDRPNWFWEVGYGLVDAHAAVLAVMDSLKYSDSSFEYINIYPNPTTGELRVTSIEYQVSSIKY